LDPYELAVASGVRTTSTLDTRDDQPLVVPTKAHGQSKLSDANLPVRTILSNYSSIRSCSEGKSASRSSSAVDETSHVHSSSLIARAEPLAGLLGARRSSLADVLLGFEQSDEFVAVERRELDGVSKRVPDELPADFGATPPQPVVLFF